MKFLKTIGSWIIEFKIRPEKGFERSEKIHIAEIIVMGFVGLFTVLVAYQQVGISNRLLKLEEKRQFPVISVEVGSYSRELFRR